MTDQTKHSRITYLKDLGIDAALHDAMACDRRNINLLLAKYINTNEQDIIELSYNQALASISVLHGQEP
jgi:hypothetical protein